MLLCQRTRPLTLVLAFVFVFFSSFLLLNFLSFLVTPFISSYFPVLFASYIYPYFLIFLFLYIFFLYFQLFFLFLLFSFVSFLRSTSTSSVFISFRARSLSLSFLARLSPSLRVRSPREQLVSYSTFRPHCSLGIPTSPPSFTKPFYIIT